MKYETAQKLVDADFPKYLCSDWSLPSTNPEDGNRILQCPSLEDLIDACGSSFASLMVGPGISLWTARGKGYEIRDEGKAEAVAGLWLMLNDKLETHA